MGHVGGRVGGNMERRSKVGRVNREFGGRADVSDGSKSEEGKHVCNGSSSVATDRIGRTNVAVERLNI